MKFVFTFKCQTNTCCLAGFFASYCSHNQRKHVSRLHRTSLIWYLFSSLESKYVINFTFSNVHKVICWLSLSLSGDDSAVLTDSWLFGFLFLLPEVHTVYHRRLFQAHEYSVNLQSQSTCTHVSNTGKCVKEREACGSLQFEPQNVIIYLINLQPNLQDQADTRLYISIH